ncbi:hypothetical protein EOD39_6952 [Acipenser ruthenus]|uniref:RNA-directed DNA polymerase from mobile element jockey n=1 Tax=Acipenser ruthenus TaxID=7906 RepID=A0A662YXX3_ACIRT|nr:hypothetical protein EOD39_6952 [Acipenser ruthenus]
MPLRSKIKIIKAIIRPNLTYASPVWSGCLDSTHLLLQRVQNKTLRIAARVSTFTRTADLHRELGIEMLDENLLKMNRKLYDVLGQNDNPLIQKLSNITENPFDTYS